MKVLYLIQTYKNQAQIKRLASTIKRLSPNSKILISHNSKSPPLNSKEFTSISGLYLIYNPGGRGDFFFDPAVDNEILDRLDSHIFK